jgi:hypothetical protein
MGTRYWLAGCGTTGIHGGARNGLEQAGVELGVGGRGD